MRSVVGYVRQFLGMSLLGAMSVATLPSYPRENRCKLPVAAVQLNSSLREQTNTEALFSRLNARHRWQDARLIRLSGVRTYKLENDKDKIVAEEAVVVEYTAPATETFTTTSGKGSGFTLSISPPPSRRWAACLFGYDIGVISGAILFIKSRTSRLSPSSMEEIVVSSVLLGSLVGAMLGGILADRLDAGDY
jgi:hypothetical protein